MIFGLLILPNSLHASLLILLVHSFVSLSNFLYIPTSKTLFSSSLQTSFLKLTEPPIPVSPPSILSHILSTADFVVPTCLQFILVMLDHPLYQSIPPLLACYIHVTS